MVSRTTHAKRLRGSSPIHHNEFRHRGMQDVCRLLILCSSVQAGPLHEFVRWRMPSLGHDGRRWRMMATVLPNTYTRRARLAPGPYAVAPAKDAEPVSRV